MGPNLKFMPALVDFDQYKLFPFSFVHKIVRASDKSAFQKL